MYFIVENDISQLVSLHLQKNKNIKSITEIPTILHNVSPNESMSVTHIFHQLYNPF